MNLSGVLETAPLSFLARKETKHPAEQGIWFHPSVNEIKSKAAKQRRMPQAAGFYEYEEGEQAAPKATFVLTRA